MKIFAVFLIFAATLLHAKDRWMYVGTYTREGGSQGIYKVRVDSATGLMSLPELAVTSSNPSFLAIARNGKFLYAANENRHGDVSAYAIEPDGKLRFLNQAKSKGAAPCHLNIDKTGKWLALANYSSGTATILPIGADGKLGEASDFVQHSGKSVNSRRQEGPHAHSVNFSADNKHLFVADLGLDQIKVYAFDAKAGKIKEQAILQAPAGAGPRHAALGKNGLVYVVNEMQSSVSAYRWAGEPKVTPIETVSAIPADYKAETSGAEVVLHKSGKLLFSSNRGHDSIAVFAVNPADGKLTAKGQVPCGGKVPRGFVQSPDGKFLYVAGQNSNSIQAFRIDIAKQTLTPVGSPITVGMPVCLRFLGK